MNNRSVQLNVRIDPNLLQKLEAFCKLQHCGKGTIVSQTLEQYFETQLNAVSQQKELIARVEVLEAQLEAGSEPASSNC